VNKMKYVLFIRETCPFCVQAQELLKEREVDFKLVKFEEDQERILQEIKDAYEWDTVPMIFQVTDHAIINFIGGYTDLEKHLSE